MVEEQLVTLREHTNDMERVYRAIENLTENMNRLGETVSKQALVLEKLMVTFEKNATSLERIIDNNIADTVRHRESQIGILTGYHDRLSKMELDREKNTGREEATNTNLELAFKISAIVIAICGLILTFLRVFGE